MYASALEVNLLQSRDVDTPCLDDWGSCGEAVGKSSAGILVHDVLVQCLNKALGIWVCGLVGWGGWCFGSHSLGDPRGSGLVQCCCCCCYVGVGLPFCVVA